MAIWDDVITEADKEVYRRAGYDGRPIALGRNPALLVIDATYIFLGDRPEPILKSIERFPLSSGESGWQAVHQIAALLPLARQKKVPVIYSVGDPSLPKEWIKKRSNSGRVNAGKGGNEVVAEIAPVAGDLVIRKVAPSIFFSTPLVSVLNPLGIDTLLFCGGVTSGCVRASVVDAASYGYKAAVIEEGTFDRGEVSHKVNLFDLNAKYANVMSAAEVRDYLNGLGVKS